MKGAPPDLELSVPGFFAARVLDIGRPRVRPCAPVPAGGHKNVSCGDPGPRRPSPQQHYSLGDGLQIEIVAERVFAEINGSLPVAPARLAVVNKRRGRLWRPFMMQRRRRRSPAHWGRRRRLGRARGRRRAIVRALGGLAVPRSITSRPHSPCMPPGGRPGAEVYRRTGASSSRLPVTRGMAQFSSVSVFLRP
jgi:hypothetical protein